MVSILHLNLCSKAFLSRCFCFLFPFLTLQTIIFVTFAFAGEWRVTPIRLTLERGMRSTVINVQNDSNEPMNFQIKGMEWIQDIDGNDQYTETHELIYFPKQLLIPPKEERIIRIGIKSGAGAREKTYRLFIEEIPSRQDVEPEQTQIAVTIRFAVPLFISPARESISGEIIETKLHDSTLDTTLKNNGNVHFRVNFITLSGMDSKGETIFSQENKGWYLLSGISRTYSAMIPEDVCSQLDSINIQVQTERLSFSRKVDVDPAMCVAQ